MKIIFTFLREMLVVSKYLTTFAPQLRKYIFPDLVAQMAESVDALVSNTSGVTSIPVRPRVWVPQTPDNRKIIRGFSFYWAY
jgi:hypothetical protein